jgi:hypothetical protein
VAFGGRETLNSRRELEVYWPAALKSINVIRFMLERVVYDPISNFLVIVYIGQIENNRIRAVEMYNLNEYSMIIRGEAMYGADITESGLGLQ